MEHLSHRFSTINTPTVTQSEADEMLKRVLAGHVPTEEPTRSLEDVALALGISEKRALRMLDEIREEGEKNRIKKGLNRERHIIAFGALGAVLLLAIFAMVTMFVQSHSNPGFASEGEGSTIAASTPALPSPVVETVPQVSTDEVTVQTTPASQPGN